jgi:hypothetical protein
MSLPGAVVALAAVAPVKKAEVVELSVAVCDEIEDAARRTNRSVAFIVRKALAAGQGAAADPPAGPRGRLELRTEEDDPVDTLKKIRAAASGRALGDAIACAWVASRERFLAWIARVEEAERAAQADDLDRELADASAQSTSAERLAALSRSEYPRVRALVAVHATTPPDTLAALARDRERSVREAAETNSRTPK